MASEHIDQLSDDEIADLAMLADGTLPASRRPEVEARVAGSPQLAAIVERQAVTLQAIRAAESVGAPVRLRADIERARGGTRPARSRRLIFAGGFAAAAAAVVAALVVVLGSAAPTVAQTAELGTKPPTQPAPRPVAGTPQLLNASVDDVPFPNYRAKFGWAAAGAREDEPSDRETTTVFYDKGGREIAYSIVSGDALDEPSDARVTTRGGVEYRTFSEDGRNVVTWERDGRTCVLSGADVTDAELVELADWRGMGAIPF